MTSAFNSLRSRIIPFRFLFIYWAFLFDEAKGKGSGVFVESDRCGDELADCIEASNCFKHGPRTCRGDEGTIYDKTCQTFIPACKPCFPFSQCGENNNITTNPQDNPECLPFRVGVQNHLGKLAVISCEFSERDGYPFPHPSSYSIGGNRKTIWYQCCQDPIAMPPFVQDLNFRITVYTSLACYSLMTVWSSIIIIALLIPLWIQLRKGRRNERGISRKKRVGLSYSTFNLYLVYLAIPDFIYALFRLGLEGSMANEKFTSHFFSMFAQPSYVAYDEQSPDGVINAAYTSANLYLNAVVSYEVFVLLRSSMHLRKKSPPSIARANIQAGIVYLSVAIWAVVLSAFHRESTKAENNGQYRKSIVLSFSAMTTTQVLMLLPIGYVISISILVWYRGYIPSLDGITARGRAVRELFFFFFRIVMIFILLWVPGLVVTMYGHWTQLPWLSVLSSYIIPIQSFATACMILTKSDVRKYVVNLVTLSYLFDGCKHQSDTRSKCNQTPGVEDFLVTAATNPTTKTKREPQGTILTLQKMSTTADVCGSVGVSDKMVEEDDEDEDNVGCRIEGDNEC